MRRLPLRINAPPDDRLHLLGTRRGIAELAADRDLVAAVVILLGVVGFEADFRFGDPALSVP
jgi:hypothetical protein